MSRACGDASMFMCLMSMLGQGYGGRLCYFRLSRMRVGCSTREVLLTQPMPAPKVQKAGRKRRVEPRRQEAQQGGRAEHLTVLHAVAASARAREHVLEIFLALARLHSLK